MLSVLLAAVSLAYSADSPSPALAQFEQRVVSTLASRNDEATKAGLRREFRTVSDGAPLTPPNQEARGRILRLLGDAGASAAVANAALAEGRRRFEARDYEGALAYANAVLAGDPSNSGAVALKMMSAGRTKTKEQVPAPLNTPLPSAMAIANEADPRPHRLVSRISAKTIRVPSLPGSELLYISKEAKPPSRGRRLWNGIRSVVEYNFHRRTPEENAGVESIKRLLESTPSGSRLISDLGGWKSIEEKVDVGFSPIASPGVVAYVRNKVPDLQGRNIALVLNTRLLKEPPEVAAPILAHELTHVLHKVDGRYSFSLSIPSEFAAHRQQVYVFLELSAGLSEDRHRELQSRPQWVYQQFLADLWQDRITQRFDSSESFESRYRVAEMNYEAGRAYEDLLKGVVDAGSPHLDHHIAAPEEGVYTAFTDEKDILTEVNERKGREDYSKSLQQEDDRLLGRRAAIILPMDQFDSDYRAANGWRLD